MVDLERKETVQTGGGYVEVDSGGFRDKEGVKVI